MKFKQIAAVAAVLFQTIGASQPVEKVLEVDCSKTENKEEPLCICKDASSKGKNDPKCDELFMHNELQEISRKMGTKDELGPKDVAGKVVGGSPAPIDKYPVSKNVISNWHNHYANENISTLIGFIFISSSLVSHVVVQWYARLETTASGFG